METNHQATDTAKPSNRLTRRGRGEDPFSSVSSPSQHLPPPHTKQNKVTAAPAVVTYTEHLTGARYKGRSEF